MLTLRLIPIMKLQKIVSLAALVALCAAPVFAETTNPKLKEGKMPDYPTFARSHDVKGTVMVEALVDENGNVFAADVVKSVHKELDKAAIAAISDWKFEPATDNGKPVMKVVRIPVKFDLIDPIKESLRSHDTAIAQN
jgi:TonB family protein